MKRIENYESIQANTKEFKRPTAGGYICQIIDVKDVPINKDTDKGDYLKINYDIIAGEFKGYYTEQFERWGGNWYASFIRSYKEKAYGMFKHFTNCIEESNPDYKWNFDERSLVGKFIGLVIGEEEYINSAGEIKKRMYVYDVKSVVDIANGDFKIPELKKVQPPIEKNTMSNFVAIDNDDDLPF